jgi:hypothetical protein
MSRRVQIVRHQAGEREVQQRLSSPIASHIMPVTNKLPPIAVQVVRTLMQTYDRRGPNAFDEDATKVFLAIGSIIAEICGRERMYDAMDALDRTVETEGIGLPDGSRSRSIN